MSDYVLARAGCQGDIAVVAGSRLTAGVVDGPSLSAHRRRWPEPVRLRAKDLIARLEPMDVRGRGGAGFPFVRKLSTAVGAGRRREVVVNAAEGEPGSAKDSALMITAPHLVLDGAEIAARALGVSTVHVVLPGERPGVLPEVRRAVRERSGSVTFELHATTGGFVGGQSVAVVELLEGRENLPVSSFAPQAVSGLHGRPTLLSNAETFAQVAAAVALGAARYAEVGLPGEPGTMLVTVAGDTPHGVVLEVPYGTALREVLALCGYDPGGPVLLGGYHGAWLSPAEAGELVLSRSGTARAGASLGAGVVLPLDPSACPVTVTALVVEYLAGQSARRCGPCLNGLPALADALAKLAGLDRSDGRPDARRSAAAAARASDLLSQVERRGACAHPDGTARLVRSLMTTFPDEVQAHRDGGCTHLHAAAWTAGTR